MFDIYWNDDCISGRYDTKEEAYIAIEKIAKTSNLFYLGGGSDGPNSWGVYRYVDPYGFPEYCILSIVKNNYKIKKS